MMSCQTSGGHPNRHIFLSGVAINFTCHDFRCLLALANDLMVATSSNFSRFDNGSELQRQH
jgi:hypothetical protein